MDLDERLSAQECVKPARLRASPKMTHARRFGLPARTYSEIETGDRALKGDELVQLADRFGVRAGAITGLAQVEQRPHSQPGPTVERPPWRPCAPAWWATSSSTPI